MDSKEFLMSEHNMLRSEIRERINDIELLQRNALIFSGAIWAWLATRGWNPTYIFVVCLPFVITSLFWLKSKITSKDIRKFATYIKKVEGLMELPKDFRDFRDVHKFINNYQKQPNKISMISYLSKCAFKLSN